VTLFLASDLTIRKQKTALKIKSEINKNKTNKRNTMADKSSTLRLMSDLKHMTQDPPEVC